jgi:hypothetical protein
MVCGEIKEDGAGAAVVLRAVHRGPDWGPLGPPPFWKPPEPDFYAALVCCECAPKFDDRKLVEKTLEREGSPRRGLPYLVTMHTLQGRAWKWAKEYPSRIELTQVGRERNVR